jgi:hypothetical protein
MEAMEGLDRKEPRDQLARAAMMPLPVYLIANVGQAQVAQVALADLEGPAAMVEMAVQADALL